MVKNNHLKKASDSINHKVKKMSNNHMLQGMCSLNEKFMNMITVHKYFCLPYVSNHIQRISHELCN